MLYMYGVTCQGIFHKKNDEKCQDAHRIIKVDDRIIVAAVADGLGSEKYSDIASEMAVEISTMNCANNITTESTKDDILRMIRNSFELSQSEIEKTAQDRGHSFDQYDTTLTLAVMVGDSLYFGHSGDSGIIAMNVDGSFSKITEQQRDADGFVYPLCSRNRWEFKKYEKRVVSVLLATDGVLEIFFPVYIRNEKISIYTALANFFMNPRIIDTQKGETVTEDRMSSFIESIPGEQISDDKTVVVLINTDTPYSLQPDIYYEEPDWSMLKRKYEEELINILYPGLFQ